MSNHQTLPGQSGNFPLKRISLIDALRGFALFGIIINHIAYGFLAGPPPSGNEQFNIFSPVDNVLNIATFLLTGGKFFTIFSFLFGLSFAIQLSHAEEKNNPFALRFLWRIVLLFAIGFVHNMFFSGDILTIYAVLGLFLLPSRFLGNRAILIISFLLILNLPGTIQSLIQVTNPLPPSEAAAAGAFAGEEFAKEATKQFNIKQTGSLMDVIRMNIIGGLVGKFQFQVMTGRLWITFGLFLLGMYAGRKRLFEYTIANRRFFKRLFIWSGCIALASTVLAIVYSNMFGAPTTLLQVFGNFSFSVHQAFLSVFYVSGFVLLYWKAVEPGRLKLLAPVGQMGLTTYLMQSVFGLFIFYGFGLGMIGKIGVTASIGLGLVIFLLQIVFANWWLKRYQYGIIEWLWRSLTDFKIYPMRKVNPPDPGETKVEPVVVTIDRNA